MLIFIFKKKATSVSEPNCAILPYYALMAIQFQEPACLEFVIYARVANLLQNKPEGVHVDDLAKQSGLDADKIGRVLRMLATRHFFKEGQCHDTVHLRMIASS